MDSFFFILSLGIYRTIDFELFRDNFKGKERWIFFFFLIEKTVLYFNAIFTRTSLNKRGEGKIS